MEPVRIGPAECVVDDDRHAVLGIDQGGAGQPAQDAELFLGAGAELVEGDGGAVLGSPS